MDSRVSFEGDLDTNPPMSGEHNKIQEMQIATVDSDPPSYSSKTNGPPPSYASIFGQLKDAKDDSDGNVDFAKKVIPIVTCGGLCNIAVIFAVWVVTLACIAVGAAYKDRCPASPMIPVYLIVFGTFYTLKVLFAVLKYLRHRYEEEPEAKELPIYLKTADGCIDCFLSIWFIVGNVYVYRLNGKYQWEDPTAEHFCHHGLYQFAFWVITLQYIITLVTLCLACVFCCVFCCVFMKKIDKDLV